MEKGLVFDGYLVVFHEVSSKMNLRPVIPPDLRGEALTP
jgi:hypothetical protein